MVLTSISALSPETREKIKLLPLFIQRIHRFQALLPIANAEETELLKHAIFADYLDLVRLVGVKDANDVFSR